MWPFKRKIDSLPVPVEPVDVQLKSLTLPQAQPTWRLYAKHHQGWDVKTAIEEGYNASAIVYACVEKRAKLASSVPWIVMRRSGDEWEEAGDNPLSRLIESPNPDMSFHEIMYLCSQAMDLAGNAFVSEIRAGSAGLPRELWPLPPEYMKIKPGRERLVDYFEYADTTTAGRIIQPEDMIHFKMPNPGSRVFGMPILKAGGRATDIDRESGIWQKTSLENRGASDINIKLPEGATKEQVDRAREQYKDMQAGAKNARKAMITNAEFQQLGQTAVEMDFVDSRRAVWTEICAVFGLSLANLGMTEDVNLANARAMDKALWQNTIIPQLEMMKRQLNHQLASEFGEQYKLTYDLTNVEALQEGRDEKLKHARDLFAMGVPFNVINQKLELGLEEVEGGDIGYLPATLVPSFGQDDGQDDEGIIGDDVMIGGSDKVQDQALNGAQISSLQAIVQSVADGLIPLESAVGVMATAFPGIDEAQARSILSPAANWKPRDGGRDESEKRLMSKIAYGK